MSKLPSAEEVQQLFELVERLDALVCPADRSEWESAGLPVTELVISRVMCSIYVGPFELWNSLDGYDVDADSDEDVEQFEIAVMPTLEGCVESFREQLRNYSDVFRLFDAGDDLL